MTTKDFINLFDHFGIKPQLYYDNQTRYNTCIGAFTTIAVTFAILALILYFFVLFVLGDGMTVVFSKDNLKEDLYHNISQEIFLIRMHDISGKSINPRIATIKAILWTYNGTDLKVTPIEMEPCSYERTINKEAYERINGKMNITDYYCISPNQEVSLSIGKDSVSGSFLNFFLVKCNSREDSSCFTPNEINTALNNTTFYIVMNYQTVMIDHYNTSSPIIKTNAIKSEMMSTSLNYDLTLNWKGVKYISDKGWLFNSLEEINSFEFDTSYTQIMIHNNPERYYIPGTFASIKATLNPYSIDIYHRSYPKIQTIIANVGGLMKVIILVGEILVYLFSNGLYISDLIKANPQITNYNERVPLSTIRLHDLSIEKSLNQFQTIAKRKMTLKKINLFHSIQWMICPKLNSNTVYLTMCQRKIYEYLSINNVIQKLLLMDMNNGKGLKVTNKGNEVIDTNKSEILYNKRVPLKSMNKSPKVLESSEML